MLTPLARLIALAVLTLAPAARAAAPAPADAQAVLDAVVARLPQERLGVDGDLIVRELRGVVTATLRFDILLDWGASPASARYTIRDNFGGELEQLTLMRTPGGAVQSAYTAAGAPAPTPSLNARIQGTDMCWIDLALDFLWWPDARIVGEASVKGRRCHILEIPAPAPPAAAPAPGAALDQYQFVRLWIDQEAFVLMRAEAYNASGVRVRRLWVRSLKKQDDRWMIKDLEVQAYPPVQRTRLHVRNVFTLENAPAEPPEVMPEAP